MRSVAGLRIWPWNSKASACRLWLADVCCVQLKGLVNTTRLTGWSNYLVDSRVSGQVKEMCQAPLLRLATACSAQR